MISKGPRDTHIAKGPTLINCHQKCQNFTTDVFSVHFTDLKTDFSRNPQMPGISKKKQILHEILRFFTKTPIFLGFRKNSVFPKITKFLGFRKNPQFFHEIPRFFTISQDSWDFVKKSRDFEKNREMHKKIMIQKHH